MASWRGNLNLIVAQPFALKLDYSNIRLSSIITQLPVLTFSRSHHELPKIRKTQNLFSNISFKCSSANTSQWESSPVESYAPENSLDDTFPKRTTTTNNIFETLITKTEPTKIPPIPSLQYLKTPLWLLGPALLLLTGMVPTLWLPLPSVFLGPNIATLLSFTGLDCIFNLGASLFLLISDSTARPADSTQNSISGPPLSYRIWNMAANMIGFIIPLLVFLGSQRGIGFLQPRMDFISFAVLLAPYLLLLAVQALTEMLTWHWRSPAWLVGPVVYEAYRLLQLMRGLRIGDELGAPSWVVHTVRGLVCCWVLVLGVQLMRVAWFVGFRGDSGREKQSDADGGY